METGANRPTGPYGRDEYDQQGYHNPRSLRGNRDGSSAELAPIEGEVTPARREPLPTLAELQQLQEARAFAVRLKVEVNNGLDLHTDISRRMQAEPLTGDLDGQTQQAAIRATVARVIMRRIDNLEENPGPAGYSEQWTTRHDYRPGFGGS